MPETVQTAELVEAKVTGSPELAVAESAKGIPTVCPPGLAKLMVWFWRPPHAVRKRAIKRTNTPDRLNMTEIAILGKEGGIRIITETLSLQDDLRLIILCLSSNFRLPAVHLSPWKLADRPHVLDFERAR